MALRSKKSTDVPLPLTPYAELLVRPSMDDKEVRRAFHALVSRPEARHPDCDGKGGVPGPRWYAVAGAYSKLKTAASRAAWEAGMRALSSTCPDCDGFGVQGSRLTRVRLCAGCGGAGRRRRGV